jgi:CRP/FNR family transcriptional regulator, cyclic AMP receptor protein
MTSELTPSSAVPVAVCLLDVDLDLARAIPQEDHALARRALNVRELVVEPGTPIGMTGDDALALVVVAGTLWREVRLGGAAAPQLLDGGSVLLCEPPAPGTLAPDVTTVALSSVRLAVLDRRYLLAATRWPGLMTVLHRRVAEQQRDLATQAAIAHLPRVEDRIEFLLWHLAERWGHVHADGIHVGLRLTHAALGRFVGARRPTVSLALAQLRERGVLDRGPNATWILHGEPPAVSGSQPHPAPPDIM